MSPELETAIRNRTIMEICELLDGQAELIEQQATIIKEQQRLIELLREGEC